MAAGNVLATNFLFIIFLVVPGLAGIKGFLLAKREPDNYSRIETVVFSLMISILSILLLYLSYSLLIFKFADFNDIDQFGLPNIIFIFITHLMISPIIGISLGMLVNVAVKREFFSRVIQLIPYIDENSPRKEVWDLVFSEIHSNSAVSVITQKGHIITGNVVQRGEKVQERDLLLSRPSLKILMENGDYSEKDLSDKTYSYVHNQNISQILFQEDLNRGDESVAESMDIESDEEIKDLYEVLKEHEPEMINGNAISYEEERWDKDK